MPSIFTLGQTGDLGTRGDSGGREEVAGGGVGEVLEEGREGAQSRHRPSLEVVPHWVRQAGLVTIQSIPRVYISFVLFSALCIKV